MKLKKKKKIKQKSRRNWVWYYSIRVLRGLRLLSKIFSQTLLSVISDHDSRVSCQKGPNHHAYAWQIGPFWQDTLELTSTRRYSLIPHSQDRYSTPKTICWPSNPGRQITPYFGMRDTMVLHANVRHSVEFTVHWTAHIWYCWNDDKISW